MLHDDYLCLVESGKQQITEVTRKFKRKTWKQRQLLRESGFVLRTAPPPLSRDRRIKMKKSINQTGRNVALCRPPKHFYSLETPNDKKRVRTKVFVYENSNIFFSAENITLKRGQPSISRTSKLLHRYSLRFIHKKKKTRFT